MKVVRSTKCSLKFLTKAKQSLLVEWLEEYRRGLRFFIDTFWKETPKKTKVGKPEYDLFDSWLAAYSRSCAVREAIDIIDTTKKSAKKLGKTPSKPKLNTLSAWLHQQVELKEVKDASEFDAWLHLCSLGRGIILDIPIRFHKHYYKWRERGELCNSCRITPAYVQFSFKIETGPKKTRGEALGLDTGINKLAALSDGSMYGADIWEWIDRVNRCEHGSNGHRRAVRAIEQRQNEIAKEIFEDHPDLALLVVENLKGMKYKMRERRRLSKNMRRVVGSWLYSEWLEKLEQLCESNRVTFRRVSPYHTSQECPACGHTDKGNRKSGRFRCLECGCTGDADSIAAGNLLNRFLTGPYGARFKPLQCGGQIEKEEEKKSA